MCWGFKTIHMRSFLLLIGATLLSISLFAQSDSLDRIIADPSAARTEKLRALKGLTQLYYLKDFDKTIIAGEQAAAFTKSAEDSILYGGILLNVGVAHYFKGNYDTAARYYYQSLGILERSGNRKEQAYVLNELAKLYRKTRDLNRSLSYYEHALALFRQIGDSSGVQMVLNESGVVYEYLEQYDKAIQHYNASMEIATALNDKAGIGWAKSFIAGVQVIQKKFPEAEKNLQEVLALRQNLKDSFSIALTHSDLGALYNASGEYAKARMHLLQSNDIARKMKYAELQSNNFRELAAIAEKDGKPGEALEYFRMYSGLKDSIFSVEKNRQIAELNTRYETEKKEQQILLQRSQLDLQQSELVRKNITLIAIAVLVGLAALLIWSGYRRYRLKQKALIQAEILRQQELSTRAVLEAEERERQRIAKDLHDGVGQIMSAAKMNLSSFEHELQFGSAEQQQKFQRIISLVDESCKEVRSVSHNMMPNALLKAGLAAAIREFTDKIDDKILRVNLYAEGLDQRLDTNLETVLYRVVQECVNNVIKHSGANHLDISLIRDADGISATIEDNGRGFDASDPHKKEGLGLKNIRTRVEYLKGTVEFNSHPGKGTLVAIHVPAEQTALLN